MHFIGLQLEVFLALLQVVLLVSQVLSTLLKSVRLQSVLSLGKSDIHFFKLIARVVDLVQELVVVILEFLVLVSLLRI
jgi:hypothetical protein